MRLWITWGSFKSWTRKELPGGTTRRGKRHRPPRPRLESDRQRTRASATRPRYWPDEVRALIKACSNRAPTGIRNRALLVLPFCDDAAFGVNRREFERQPPRSAASSTAPRVAISP